MGSGIFGGLLTFILWILVILFIVWLIRRSMTMHHGQGMKWMMKGEDALDVLKARYAKGEIDKKEFEEKKKDLEV